MGDLLDGKYSGVFDLEEIIGKLLENRFFVEQSLALLQKIAERNFPAVYKQSKSYRIEVVNNIDLK